MSCKMEVGDCGKADKSDKHNWSPQLKLKHPTHSQRGKVRMTYFNCKQLFPLYIYIYRWDCKVCGVLESYCGNAVEMSLYKAQSDSFSTADLSSTSSLNLSHSDVPTAVLMLSPRAKALHYKSLHWKTGLTVQLVEKSGKTMAMQLINIKYSLYCTCQVTPGARTPPGQKLWLAQNGKASLRF